MGMLRDEVDTSCVSILCLRLWPPFLISFYLAFRGFLSSLSVSYSVLFLHFLMLVPHSDCTLYFSCPTFQPIHIYYLSSPSPPAFQHFFADHTCKIKSRVFMSCPGWIRVPHIACFCSIPNLHFMAHTPVSLLHFVCYAWLMKRRKGIIFLF